MCMGGGRAYQPQQPAPVQLPPAPQVSYSAPLMIQSTPKTARPASSMAYQKKGKRALTIPMNQTAQTGG